MAEKKPDTPNGIICAICGEDKQPHHFTLFHRLSAEDEAFFINARRDVRNNYRNDVCWECNGGYRCLECGNVFPASDFRVQGRYCKHCKSKWKRPAKRAKFIKSPA